MMRPTTLTLVLDSPDITADQTRELAQAFRMGVPLVTKAWGLPDMTIQTSLVAKPGTINVFLTERNRQMGALGWHGQENGLPAAWISPNASGVIASNVIGHDTAIFGLQIPEANFTFPGMASVVFHEICELLVDPLVVIEPTPENPGMWATDKDGNQWLIEVSDQANSLHFPVLVETRLRGLITVKVKISRFRTISKKVWGVYTKKRTVILAGFALKSFYDINGVYPFTYPPSPTFTTPFQHVKGCYAYIRNGANADMAFFDQYRNPDD
jgi:hypothetical protein